MKVGKSNLRIFHSYLAPLEWNLNYNRLQQGYCKLLCDASDQMRIVGAHILSPQAGEIVQGLAIAMKAGATKDHFDDTIGIHPTIAEEWTTLREEKLDGVELPPKTS